MSTFDPATGLSTPDYNSFWGRTARAAMESKVGVEDPGQALWSKLLMLPPEFSEPAGAKPLPAEPEGAEPPGIGNRMMDFLGGFFGGDASGATAAPSVQPGPVSPKLPAGIFPETAGVPAPAQAPPAPAGSGTQRPGHRPRVRTKRPSAKPIETMTEEEITALVYSEQEAQDLSQDEINRIEARLRALGVGPR